jgi:hypothetical protein
MRAFPARSRGLPALLACLFTLHASCAIAAIVNWTSSSGLFPNQAFPAYSLVDTALPENPVLGSSLVLSTDQSSEDMFYRMRGSDITMPANLVIEFRARFVSGNSAVPFRAPISVAFATLPTAGGGLHVGADSIFLQASPNTNGQSTALDTDGGFHDYRIEVTGTAPGSPIKVFYDGVEILSGFTFDDAGTGHFGGAANITWGEASSATDGTMEFQRFSHNAGTIPEPGSVLLLLCGVSFCVSRRRGSPRSQPIEIAVSTLLVPR